MLKLKELRKSHKISQQELASFLGVTQATLSGWENEKYEIDNKSLIACADYFNVSVDALLGRSEDIKNTAPVNDADNLIYMSEYTDENIVLISRKNSKSKKYILTDNQITVVESLLSEFRAELPPLPGTLVAEGGEENKTGRRTRKPTL